MILRGRGLLQFAALYAGLSHCTVEHYLVRSWGYRSFDRQPVWFVPRQDRVAINRVRDIEQSGLSHLFALYAGLSHFTVEYHLVMSWGCPSSDQQSPCRYDLSHVRIEARSIVCHNRLLMTDLTSERTNEVSQAEPSTSNRA